MPSHPCAASPLRISVVIPVYNRVKWLRGCVESVVNQAFAGLEVIVVDDGSTDETPALCDQLAEQYPSVRVMHRANGGVSAARAMGVGAARGEWITFVDSDDRLPPGALSTLWAAAQGDTDIVVGSATERTRGWGNSYSSRQYLRRLIMGRRNIGVPWGKLFRRSLFTPDAFAFPREIVMGEDLLMNLQLALASGRRVRRVRGRVYTYVQHEENVTRTFCPSLEYLQQYHELRRELFPPATYRSVVRATIARRLRELRRLRRASGGKLPQGWRAHLFTIALRCDLLHYPFLPSPADIALLLWG